MKKIVFTALMLPMFAMADDVPPPKPPTDEILQIPLRDLQGLAEKLGDVPMKYAAPVMQELQRIVTTATLKEKDKKK